MNQTQIKIKLTPKNSESDRPTSTGIMPVLKNELLTMYIYTFPP